jgi:hypothetical protein
MDHSVGIGWILLTTGSSNLEIMDGGLGGVISTIVIPHLTQISAVPMLGNKAPRT